MTKVPKIILLIERARAFGRGLLDGIIQYSTLPGSWLFYMKPEFYIPGKKKSHKWFRTLDEDGIIAHTKEHEPYIVIPLNRWRFEQYLQRL